MIFFFHLQTATFAKDDIIQLNQHLISTILMILMFSAKKMYSRYNIDRSIDFLCLNYRKIQVCQ